MSANTKTKLLNASHTLFLTEGYDDTKVEDICKLANTAKGSFFYYFDKKETVVEALLLSQIKAMAQQLQETLKHIDSPVDQLSMLMSILLYQGQIGPESMHYFKNEIPNWFDHIAHIYRDEQILPIIKNITFEGMQKGYFSSNCNEQTVEIIYFGISSYVHRNFKTFYNPNFMKQIINNFEFVLNTVLDTKLDQITIKPI